MSDNLRDNKTLIAGEDDHSSMVGSTERFTKISIRGSSTSVGQERVSYCNDTNSAVTLTRSSRTSGSTMTEGSGSASIFAVKRSGIS